MRRLFALVAVALLLAGCASDHGGMHDMMEPAAAAGGKYSSTDLMFAEMMIPHHQQAVEMSDLAMTRSTNPDVLALAEEIRDAQAPEIEQMRSWGATGEEHMGHQMMGMLSDDELRQLADASGIDFDRLFLAGMIKHHEGAIDMAQMIVASKNPEVQSLGDSIVTSQTAEIERMRTMLAALG